MHNGDLPRNPLAIEDIEICKFIVGLTRTRMKCTILVTKHFADKWMKPSALIAWIQKSRYHLQDVTKEYWKRA